MKSSIKELVYNSILLLSLLLLSNCENKKSPVVQRLLTLGELRKATIDSNLRYISVQILRSYPIQMDCGQNVRYANLYICKKNIPRQDTLYVFDECSKAPDFAIDTSVHVEVGFYVSDMLKVTPKQVTVFVSKEFRMPKNAKYVFVGLVKVPDF